jgi:hypothetical protein
MGLYQSNDDQTDSDICAALAAGLAGTRLRWRRVSGSPRSVLFDGAGTGALSAGGYPADYRRAPGAPDFDALDEEDDAPNAQSSTALPPPGPVLSPADPRYGRPLGVPPVYSDRGAPTGPILSPDDPRYGRTDGPPPVIYSDRPAGPPQQTYSDRGNDDGRIPGSGFIYPNDDNRGLRPPGAIGPQGTVTGTVQPAPVGPDGRPTVLSALPPDEQPEVGTAPLPANLRRQEVTFPTKEPAGTLIVDTPNTYLYYVLGGGRAIRQRPRRPRRLHLDRGQKISRKAEWPDWHPPTEMIERQPYLPRFMAGGPGNPLGARAMYLGSPSIASTAPTSPRRSASSSRPLRHAERGCLRPVRSREGRHPWSCARRASAGNRDGLGAALARPAGRHLRPRKCRRAGHAAHRRAAAARASDSALGRGINDMIRRARTAYALYCAPRHCGAEPVISQ